MLRDGDVCLVDAGGEYGLYTADVTRTFPVSGSFSGAQRDLYQACLAAQKQAIEAVKPGATIDGIHAVTVRALTEGLVGLGLLPGPVEERIAEGDRLLKLTPGSPEERAAPKGYRKYYMHRTSHWLGMDVHDVGDYVVDGASRPLDAGHGADRGAGALRGRGRRDGARGRCAAWGSGSRTTCWSPRPGTRT